MSRYQRVLSRWLLLPLVLAGVVAMHVLAGGSHSGHAATSLPSAPAAAPMSASSPSHGGAATGEDHGATPSAHAAHRIAAGLSATASVLQPHSALPGSGSMPAMSMCLAVLFTAVLLLAPPRLQSATGLSIDVPELPWRRTERPCRAPPRDLLTQLCVLRT